jgi:hypothetical protein
MQPVVRAYLGPVVLWDFEVSSPVVCCLMNSSDIVGILHMPMICLDAASLTHSGLKGYAQADNAVHV